MNQWFSWCATCVVVVFASTFLLGITDYDPKPLTYEVKPGDTLYGIAAEFGHYMWWIEIYEANEEKIDNPNLIFPGQELQIPSFVFQVFKVPVTMDDVDRVLAMSQKFERQGKEAKSEKKLKKFREAFDQLVKKRSKK